MLQAGIRMLSRRLQYSLRGTTRYTGSHQDICHAIIKECWNGKYVMTSKGHFRDFYVRDFALCVPALLKWDMEDYVFTSLAFALDTYAEQKRITSAISPSARPFDFFDVPAVDSLPFLIHSLALCKEHNKAKTVALIKKHKGFLEEQVLLFCSYVDDKTGLIKKHSKLSSIKDHYIRDRSCYAHCMVGMLKSDLETLNLHNPLKAFNYKKILLDHYYTGSYFKDSLHNDTISGDANTFPFYCGIIDDKETFSSCLKAIQQEKLDEPFPLKYTKHQPKDKMISQFLPFLAPNYETSAVWIHLGLCFITVVQKYDPMQAQGYLRKYTQLVEQHKNFLEVYHETGRPYTSLFYVSDDAMSWAVIYLSLLDL